LLLYSRVNININIHTIGCTVPFFAIVPTIVVPAVVVLATIVHLFCVLGGAASLSSSPSPSYYVVIIWIGLNVFAKSSLSCVLISGFSRQSFEPLQTVIHKVIFEFVSSFATGARSPRGLWLKIQSVGNVALKGFLISWEVISMKLFWALLVSSASFNLLFCKSSAHFILDMSVMAHGSLQATCWNPDDMYVERRLDALPPLRLFVDISVDRAIAGLP
jgi:hypothetical protein